MLMLVWHVHKTSSKLRLIRGTRSLIFVVYKNIKLDESIPLRRPISLRPRNLPTKARALKRWMALQRYEALSEHIMELEKAMEQLKSENGDSNDKEGNETSDSDEHSQIDNVFNSNLSEDEWKSSDEDEREDLEDSDSEDFDDDNEDTDYQPL